MTPTQLVVVAVVGFVVYYSSAWVSDRAMRNTHKLSGSALMLLAALTYAEPFLP